MVSTERAMSSDINQLTLGHSGQEIIQHLASQTDYRSERIREVCYIKVSWKITNGL